MPIVALAQDGDVYFSCDSKASDTLSLRPKWIKEEPVIIATTNQFLLQNIEIGLPFNGTYVYGDIVKYTNTLKSNFPNTPFEMLIGGGGNLFLIKDYCVVEVEYWAIGEGVEVALGAMFSFEGNPALRVEKAVRAASKWSTAGGYVFKEHV